MWGLFHTYQHFMPLQVWSLVYICHQTKYVTASVAHVILICTFQHINHVTAGVGLKSHLSAHWLCHFQCGVQFTTVTRLVIALSFLQVWAHWLCLQVWAHWLCLQVWASTLIVSAGVVAQLAPVAALMASLFLWQVWGRVRRRCCPPTRACCLCPWDSVASPSSCPSAPRPRAVWVCAHQLPCPCFR